MHGWLLIISPLEGFEIMPEGNAYERMPFELLPNNDKRWGANLHWIHHYAKGYNW